MLTIQIYQYLWCGGEDFKCGRAPVDNGTSIIVGEVKVTRREIEHCTSWGTAEQSASDLLIDVHIHWTHLYQWIDDCVCARIKRR